MNSRPCWVEISTGSFQNNYQVLVQSSAADAADARPVELLAIVKADAYGHGLALCAPAAVQAGARWLGVTSVEEGVATRKFCAEAGVAEPEILVIGGPFPGQSADVMAHRLTAVVWQGWQLDELEAAARAVGCEAGTVPVHLELDTGMSRQGVGTGELDAILARFLDGRSALRVGGLMTHLYAADESDGEATREQLELTARMVERVLAAGLKPEWLNVGNSAAVLAGIVPRELLSICDRFGMKAMARPGLALYGLAPEFVPDEPEVVSELRGKLRRVLEWKTRVVSVRSVEAGRVVGYNGTFVATEPMRLALLAVGYADGLNRALSNRGAVLIGGQRAPIVGRISMDQAVVDVTEISGVVAGDEVVLLGQQGAESITAEEHARWAGTIPWEIFTSIAARAKRIKGVEQISA
ncbi:alanine racemase [Acidicapsa acidisoli]|uniref:alanine racemase n=1 Tax=Acidicapsa acidisoli TaxID=1615681 RepID=UPI0021DFF5B5|nr:alanine racemase [Acidicapsa acidisoli]